MLQFLFAGTAAGAATRAAAAGATARAATPSTATAARQARGGNRLAIGVVDAVEVLARAAVDVHVGLQDLGERTFGNELGNCTLHGFDPLGGDGFGVRHQYEDCAAMTGVLQDNLPNFELAGAGQFVASFLEKQVAHGVLQAPAVVHLDVPELASDEPVCGLKGFGPSI